MGPLKLLQCVSCGLYSEVFAYLTRDLDQYSVVCNNAGKHNACLA